MSGSFVKVRTSDSLVKTKEIVNKEVGHAALTIFYWFCKYFEAVKISRFKGHNSLILQQVFKNFRPFPASFPHFLCIIFYHFSHTYYLVMIGPLVMLPYPHCWWFPQLWYSLISRARMTHSNREYKRRVSIGSMPSQTVQKNFKLIKHFKLYSKALFYTNSFEL